MLKTTPVMIKNREELFADLSNLSLEKIGSASDGTIKLEILKEQLFKEAGKIDTSKLKVCFLLLQIHDYELWNFSDDVVYSFSEYVQSTFDMSKSTLNECLLVARRFGLYTEIEENIQKNGYCLSVTKYAPHYKLNPLYKNYGFKQLYIMRNLSDEEIEKIGITQEMSCRDIQKAIQEYKEGLTDKTTGTEKTTTNRITETNSEKNVPLSPPEKPKEIGKITYDELKGKPLKLPPSNGGYIVLVDELGNIVVKVA